MSTSPLAPLTAAVVHTPLSLACETVKAAWLSALKKDDKCYLGHKFQMLTKPPAEGDKPTLEELSEHLKELVASSNQADKDELKVKIEKILRQIFILTMPVKPDGKAPVALPTQANGMQNLAGKNALTDLSPLNDKELADAKRRLAETDAKIAQAIEETEKRKANVAQILALNAETVLKIQKLSNKLGANENIRDSQARRLGRLKNKLGSQVNKATHFSVPKTKDEEAASKMRNELSVILAVYEYVFLARKLANLEYTLMTRSNVIKSDTLVQASLRGVELNPRTTEGFAFVCRWARIFTKDPKGSAHAFSIRDLKSLSQGELTELQSFCSSEHEEIKNMATSICILISMLKDRTIRDELTPKLSKATERLKSLSELQGPEFKNLLLKYAPWFLASYQQLKESQKMGDLSNPASWKASIARREAWDVYTQGLFEKRGNYFAAYYKLHNQLNALKGKIPEDKFYRQFFKRSFESSLGEKSLAFLSPAELEVLSLDEPTPTSTSLLSADTPKKKDAVERKKEHKQARDVEDRSSTPPIASAPPSSYVAEEEASSTVVEEAFEDVDDDKQPAPVKDKIVFNKEYKNIQYDERVKNAEDWRHAFFWGVDCFLETEYCVEDVWRNPRGKDDRLLSLVGEIEINGDVRPGIFSYCFDENGICYHRCFANHAKGEGGFVDKIVKLVRWQIENPSVQESYNAPQPASQGTTIRSAKEQFSYRRKLPLNIVTITPKNSNCIIRLFPIRK